VKATFEQFEQLWREIDADGDPRLVFNWLAAQYQAAPRAYHTFEHVGWGLKRIDEIATETPVNVAPIKWAMWFHDCHMEFNERRDSDEFASAYFSNAFGYAAGMRAEFIDVTDDLIQCTAHMDPPQTLDRAVLIDADLSILGSSQSAFDEYERLVRLEWSHVPDDAFRAGRLAVLERFTNMRRIYHTPYGYNQWERRARFNLSQSIQKLKNAS
jgi:predicted metal-dependent HD superfamily phosphohydrolase